MTTKALEAYPTLCAELNDHIKQHFNDDVCNRIREHIVSQSPMTFGSDAVGVVCDFAEDVNDKNEPVELFGVGVGIKLYSPDQDIFADVYNEKALPLVREFVTEKLANLIAHAVSQTPEEVEWDDVFAAWRNDTRCYDLVVFYRTPTKLLKADSTNVELTQWLEIAIAELGLMMAHALHPN